MRPGARKQRDHLVAFRDEVRDVLMPVREGRAEPGVRPSHDLRQLRAEQLIDDVEVVPVDGFHETADQRLALRHGLLLYAALCGILTGGGRSRRGRAALQTPLQAVEG